MACCRLRGAAVSYRGDYRRRRPLAGHFITMREQRGKHQEKRRKTPSEESSGGGQRSGQPQRTRHPIGRETSSSLYSQSDLCTNIQFDTPALNRSTM
ncbi:hypothetical protein EYF80_020239 [Liparis tanakae]|uniref:Uncharacterized protein n=1 Tax=Liparis tanakae TaxID=230148 RepID=A0A4Z2HX40_9TELE|nr:hypothetical protein EYF80_020239 [Liparis tanakae]